MRFLPLILSLLCVVVAGVFLHTAAPLAIAVFGVAGAISLLGLYDLAQRHHSLKRNYPILANLRFLLEKVRPEIRQYFLESDTDGRPFNRSKRAIVYQRAKHQLDKRPFGTLQDPYSADFEFLTHSIAPVAVANADFRISVGGPQCRQPYALSLLNISAMSFGSLSGNAILALNKGARLGGFAHDTGEGSISRYHREGGGDIIWEVASGYFGCRNEDGTFRPALFAEQAQQPQVKMIEIKLSQGAKPGHGGVLPGAKVTPEIAAARGIRIGVDCISPAFHSAFSTPRGLMRFIAELRELSGGKPVGFKLCIGHRREFMAICKAMLATGILPDFIVIDGAEGGTGAAPLEFVDHLGMPLRDGLSFAHNCLVGAGLRKDIRLGASGRIITAFDMARVFALGADWCNMARGFMFSLGCVQALTCHTDRCPSGVATQDKLRQRALVVPDKAERVRRFHHSTLAALAELIGAAGLRHPQEITAAHIMKRMSASEVETFADLYPVVAPGSLVDGRATGLYAELWARADPDSFVANAPEPLREQLAAAE